jgi:hypothetical protein
MGQVNRASLAEPGRPGQPRAEPRAGRSSGRPTGEWYHAAFLIGTKTERGNQVKHSALSALVVALALGGSVAFAQATQAPATPEQVLEQLRKDARTEANAIIGAHMKFSSDEAAKFWPLYKAYEERRKALIDERLAILKDYAQNYGTMTDAKAAELMQRALALEAKSADAKRAFLAELQKALPAKTVARFYQVHTRLDMMVDLLFAQQIPLVQ